MEQVGEERPVTNGTPSKWKVKGEMGELCRDWEGVGEVWRGRVKEERNNKYNSIYIYHLHDLI